MSDSVILGLDILDACRAVVNVSGGTVVLNGEEIPVSLVDSDDNTMISRAILECSITIPPNSVMSVSVRIDPVPSSAYVLDSRDSLMPVLMSNVIGSGDHCVVYLINDGIKFVKHRQGKCLRTAEELDEIISVGPQELSSFGVRTVGLPSATSVPDLPDIPEHLFRNACTKSGSLRFSQFSGC